jgi:hypothetical protein
VNEPRELDDGAAPPIEGIVDPDDTAGEPAPLPPPQPAARTIPVNAAPVRILGIIRSFLSLVILTSDLQNHRGYVNERRLAKISAVCVCDVLPINASDSSK